MISTFHEIWPSNKQNRGIALTLTRLTIQAWYGFLSWGTALVLKIHVVFPFLPHVRILSFRFSREIRQVIQLSFVIASDSGTDCRFPRSVVITTSHLHLIMSFCFPKSQVMWIIYRAWNFDCVLDTSWGFSTEINFPGTQQFTSEIRSEKKISLLDMAVKNVADHLPSCFSLAPCF